MNQLMAIYTVNRAQHKFPLVAVAQNNDIVLVYMFQAYYDGVSSQPVISIEDCLNADIELDTRSILYYNNQTYQLTTSKVISRAHGVLTSGQSILIGVEHDHNVCVCLGPEKFPQIDISSWRWLKNHLIRPVLKLVCHRQDEPISEMDKVYYYNQRVDTQFITNDTLPSTTSDDEELELDLLPDFEVDVQENGDLHLLVRYPTSKIIPTGYLQLANHAGLLITEVPLSNGIAIIPHEYIVGEPIADVLYGYQKIGHL